MEAIEFHGEAMIKNEARAQRHHKKEIGPSGMISFPQTILNKRNSSDGQQHLARAKLPKPHTKDSLKRGRHVMGPWRCVGAHALQGPVTLQDLDRIVHGPGFIEVQPWDSVKIGEVE